MGIQQEAEGVGFLVGRQTPPLQHLPHLRLTLLHRPHHPNLGSWELSPQQNSKPCQMCQRLAEAAISEIWNFLKCFYLEIIFFSSLNTASSNSSQSFLKSPQNPFFNVSPGVSIINFFFNFYNYLLDSILIFNKYHNF